MAEIQILYGIHADTKRLQQAVLKTFRSVVYVYSHGKTRTVDILDQDQLAARPVVAKFQRTCRIKLEYSSRAVTN